jgi:hypothetical protein
MRKPRIQNRRCLVLRHPAWIRRIFFYIDDSWHCVIVPQRSSKEPLDGRHIALVGQRKVDRLPSGIDCSIKEPISSFDVDVDIIPLPASVGALQMRPAAPINFRTVNLKPPPHAARRCCQSSFGGHLGHLRERNRISQVPAHAPQDNVALIAAPFEWIRNCDRQYSPYQRRTTCFRNGTAISPSASNPN